MYILFGEPLLLIYGWVEEEDAKRLDILRRW